MSTVLLTKKAAYNLKAEDYTAMPKARFDSLIGEFSDETVDNLPQVALFGSLDDYKKQRDLYDIDNTKSILINDKGQIFAYLNSASNATTDTQENQGE